ncbi:nucleotide-binding universal stress UspA family protein [Desulfomicrobium macestii]|uniref:Nucleotide-binding universal stress protein, UspA family n=2 Tax=Desulfomicrobium TaxID=898 RepID=A0A8G2C3P8_DESNO|nr:MULTISPECIES: universal stress protein [Desulfomicrobium]MBE1424905.1 nucleotide-binding universal stress UspA family protein [Desulfomicrobium macestii]SFL83739.1 Nucleotide-binding universal stress protein, UspA family [Desulfomicrobium norvegicum]
MKILAALDQSTYATLVLKKAMETAAKENAELTTLTISTAPFNNLYLGEISGEFQEKIRQGVQETVQRIKDQAKAADAKVNVVVQESPSPADAIVEYAEKNGIDLIIIGNKGAGAVERFLIGSVSSKVVSHSPCSVMVIKK